MWAHSGFAQNVADSATPLSQLDGINNSIAFLSVVLVFLTHDSEFYSRPKKGICLINKLCSWSR